MPKNFYQQAKFALSVADLVQLPSDQGYEVAFAGRSNAGKSTAINAITDIKGLARSSKTPGRTQMINFFNLDGERRLVDLPGYGYAQVPLPIKRKWQQNLTQYLHKRESLRGLVLVMDIRHPLKPLDIEMAEWAINAGISLLILLTKADKLSQRLRNQALKQVAQAFEGSPVDVNIQCFSGIRGLGVDAARKLLDQWFEFADSP
ncbi:MAG: ribosome biogenesis GTP-binding protein YihA/YsxC [Gammaproteobacteria bacterium]